VGDDSIFKIIAKQKYPSACRRVKNLEAKYVENAGFDGDFCIQSQYLAQPTTAQLAARLLIFPGVREAYEEEDLFWE
jgi:hypothetical protein